MITYYTGDMTIKKANKNIHAAINAIFFRKKACFHSLLVLGIGRVILLWHFLLKKLCQIIFVNVSSFVLQALQKAAGVCRVSHL